MKSAAVALVLLSALTLSACSHAETPDDVRDVSQEIKAGNGTLNAQTEPDTPAVAVAKPSMGAGLPAGEAAQSVAPKDNGTTISLPTLTKYSVEKNEKVHLYAGQLEVGTTVEAVIFYSGNGKNDRTIDLGEATVDANGEIKKEIVIPSNIALGLYVISFNIDDALMTATIEVA